MSDLGRNDQIHRAKLSIESNRKAAPSRVAALYGQDESTSLS